MDGVFFATPHTRAFEGPHVESLLFMHKPEVLQYARLEGQAIETARNMIAAKFLKSDCTWLCMADSDATWAPDALMRLISRNVPMITGCIYRRGLPPVPTFGAYKGVGEDGYPVYDFGVAIQAILRFCERRQVAEDVEDAVTFKDQGSVDLLEIDGTGMHFCLVHRDVIAAVKPAWFKCYSGTAGEDFYFCQQVRAAGFPIYADLTVHTGHLAGPGFELGLREMLAFYRHTQELDVVKELWSM